MRPSRVVPKKRAARDAHASVAEKQIRALKARSPADIVDELRVFLYPLLTKERLRRSPAPLVLQLLKIRLDAGRLSQILRLRTHIHFVEHHQDVVKILQDHDVKYLEDVEAIMEVIARDLKQP